MRLNLIAPPFKVITLCGSLKRANIMFDKCQIYLERKGHVCFSVSNKELDNPPNDHEKLILDKVHYKKINLSDCILVLDVGGYIGQSTQGELDYAILNNKEVHYISEYPELLAL